MYKLFCRNRNSMACCNDIEGSIVIHQIPGMKKSSLLFSLLALLVCTSGCKKENINLKDIQGQWELRKAAGMFTINYPPGNGKTIRFTGSHFEMIDNGQVTKSGEFKIISDATVNKSTCLVLPAGQYKYRIIYNDNTNNGKTFLEITGNKLLFISGCFAVDAGSSADYERL